MAEADGYDESNMGDESQMTGPGAPTPLTALEVYPYCEALPTQRY